MARSSRGSRRSAAAEFPTLAASGIHGEQRDEQATRLRELGFRRAIAVDSHKSIARRVGKTVRCGIYVLEFANDEWHVGQAVDVTRRYLDHRNTYNDIVRVHCQRVPRKRLDAVERATIAGLEQRGWTLRNVAMASYPRVASSLDQILEPEALRAWCDSLSGVAVGSLVFLEKYVRQVSHNLQQGLSLGSTMGGKGR